MRRLLLPLLAASAAVLLTAATLPAEREVAAGDRIQVLFLGDDGHHVPRERVAAVHAPLFRRGIQLEYTEDLGALNATNLARFDAVMVYANQTELGARRETALVEFVRGGGGLVALHSASYCFLDSDEYLRLVGARFKSHGTGVFRARITEPDHPVMAGHAGFESWDETYVHELHADDRTILAVRDRAANEPGGAGPEPWTWLRTEGEGRVFYTASGHDLRTWTNEGFVDLVARGTRWAAGEGDPAALPEAPPFEYVDTKTGVPDYVPGQRTGTSYSMQAPLTPEASLERLAVAPGLEAHLFAAEPLLQGKPIHLAFDERGRAFVIETVDYPNERKDARGRDRIVVLEDTDGDGVADRRTVFADGLSVPTSLAFANGGVVVLQAPDTLFLADTDGDGRADVRRTLFTGWGTGDTHAGPSNLRLGLDNRLWGTVGYSGIRAEVGDEAHRFAQAIFAMEPDGSALELVASTTNNTWGLGFTEEGCVLGSTANGNPSVHAPLASRHYDRVPGLAPGALQTIAERMELHPVTDRVRQVDFHGKYTAAAGHAVYTARLLPASYWNRVAFVNSPTGHTVGQFVLEHDSSDYVTRDGWNLLASDDEWTAPVLTETGPDGAVWVIDWYNYIVQHNPTPPGFENGPGNAYVSDLRDKTRGRIWRIVPEGAEVPLDRRDLAGASVAELAAALGDENLLWRQHAQRLLVERGDFAAVPALLAHLETPNVDAVGNDPAALHSLWTLEGIGAFGDALDDDLALACEDALVRSLRHPAWGVRRAALALLPRVEWARDTILSSGLLEDSMPKVQLAALTALAEMPASEDAGAAAFAALLAASEADDRWLGDAATIAAAAHDAGFLKALLSSRLAASADGGDDAPKPNLVPNPSFEAGPEGAADGWSRRHYGGEAEMSIVRGVARTGERSLRLSSSSGTDTSAFCGLRLDPNATYRMSAWIRTEDLDRGTGRGAQLNVHELQGPVQVRTEGLDGTSDWRRVEFTFEAAGRERVTLNCLFGGWGWSRGTAWFDDVVVERVDDPILAGSVGRAVPRVMRAWAARGPVDSVVSTLSRLGDAPDALASTLLGGLAEGWPADVTPRFDDADRAVLVALTGTLGDGPRAELAALLAGWKVDLGGALDVDVLAQNLGARVRGEGAVSERVAAAERLVALGREVEALEASLDVLDVATDPELAAGLVRALGSGTSDVVATRLLDEGWPRLGPAAQRAAVTALLRRDTWTTALLERIASGALPASLVDTAQWSQLAQRGGDLAQLVESARGAAADPDRAAVVERYLDAVASGGDPSRGHAMYSEHCAKCHVLGSEGVRIGPELDGIGARSPEELLIAILDPNRSVEGTYQLWTARTNDGIVVAGRLVSETRTQIELVDANGESHLLERADLSDVVPSAVSLMPAGLEVDLGEDGLRDLLAFLALQREGH